MNRWISALLLMLACGLHAQELPVDEGTAQRQRARIAAERTEVEAAFRTQEKACYGKFSVTDCVDAARTRRRAALADLRRQEVALNDADRRRKGAERLRAIEDRNTRQSEREEAGGRANGLTGQQRDARAAEKSAASAAAASDREARGAQRQARIAQAQAQREAASQRKREESARNLKQHEERLAEADKRRAALAKRLAEKKKPPAQPLPVPP